MARRGRHHRGFNPLPPPKRGETCIAERLRLQPVGFNPLPPPKRGETSILRRGATYQEVSIHSPRRSEGRHFN